MVAAPPSKLVRWLTGVAGPHPGHSWADLQGWCGLGSRTIFSFKIHHRILTLKRNLEKFSLTQACTIFKHP